MQREISPLDSKIGLVTGNQRSTSADHSHVTETT
jgi:hypothetical protein